MLPRACRTIRSGTKLARVKLAWTAEEATRMYELELTQKVFNEWSAVLWM